MKGLDLLYKKADVVVVGAGLSGLTAAYLLQRKGYKVHVFESANQVGGRVRTERVEGFLLDRGFHLLHTAYPEFKNFIDMKPLKVKPVYNGALIRHDGEFNLLANPGKQARDLLSTMIAGNANWKDKLKMIRLLAEANSIKDKDLLLKEDITALEYFTNKGFSDKFINSFFKPFLASTFLDNDLNTPSRLALFIFKMFNKGVVGLPENGIGAVPEQIASKLKPGTIHLQSRVKKVSGAGIQLLKGDFITADRILLATSPLALNHLLPENNIDLDSKHVTCLYFAADTPPVSKPVVVLNGEDKGLVNNLCVVDQVQPSYAPEGSHLIALHVTREHDFDDEELVDEVMKEMAQWFGVKVNSWEHLKTYHIKYGLPLQKKMEVDKYALQYNDQIFVCGDHLSYGSMNAAIRSGKEVADLLHKSLRKAKKGRQVHRE
ncbi:MAG: FAD-dependent oxidoreductase [Bacteroidetes bacterium]|nr:FAD-dependent oxidoreductase [Bacteroidota bacterium]